MTSENALVVTDDNFDDMVLKSSVPVFVNFWASWCEPCLFFEVIFEKAAGFCAKETLHSYPMVKFVKINIDENPITTEKFNIQVIPSTLLFKNGVVVDKALGGRDGLDMIENEVLNELL